MLVHDASTQAEKFFQAYKIAVFEKIIKKPIVLLFLSVINGMKTEFSKTALRVMWKNFTFLIFLI